jgi:putative Holliday junction resolvase
MKILGIDYGTKRIGLAISDESQTLARELSIVSPKEFATGIDGIIADEGVAEIVVGLPLNMDGGDTDKTREAREFARQLEKKSLSVHLVDERLSSAMAANAAGTEKNIDSLAAQMILQTYLDRQKIKQ